MKKQKATLVSKDKTSQNETNKEYKRKKPINEEIIYEDALLILIKHNFLSTVHYSF